MNNEAKVPSFIVHAFFPMPAVKKVIFATHLAILHFTQPYFHFMCQAV
jgi:hypothetical protein